ncbi:MAG: stage 0 sporulation protein [Clostridia bacterium]|nr:stage 0 sporulation protein [Clostridia bacterium]
MNRVVKVKFRNTPRLYFFDALGFTIKAGQGLIVDTARGQMLGEAVAEPEETPDEKLVAPLKPVIRIATPEDYEQNEHFRAKEPEAEAICQKKIAEHGLGMRLVGTEYSFNGTKLTFYFTADARVDFRELLKDLTSIFKTRIELRQIGERDEAKKCGGLGFCGRPICCNTFLNEFTPVSIKMAKSQNLSLNPVKISGICGKLMCCLRYEQESYEQMAKIMPKVGKEFVTPDGVGTVLENNIISETTKLKVTLADGTFDVRSYPFRELESINKAAQPVDGEQPAQNTSGGEQPEAEPAGAANESGEQPANESPVSGVNADERKTANRQDRRQNGNNDRQKHDNQPFGDNKNQNRPAGTDQNRNAQQYRPKFRNNRPYNNRNRQRSFVPNSDGSGGNNE